MLAKVIGFGHTRDEACARLARALTETRVHGVATNRDLLIAILREPEFRAGAIDTAYLERHDPATLLTGTRGIDNSAIHALVAALAAQAERRATTSILPRLPSGWRTLPSADQRVNFTLGDTTIDVAYRFHRGNLVASVAHTEFSVSLIKASGQMVDAEVDGVRRRYKVFRDGLDYYVDSALGSTTLREVERFPDPTTLAEAGSLVAPMPGAVVRIEVIEGSQVAAGAPIIVLEAMKMEHAVRAPTDGVVSAISVAAGDQVESGQVLAVVSADGQRD
jgi:acetyl/propionyl-CoA carboxylase alpha subunit